MSYINKLKERLENYFSPEKSYFPKENLLSFTVEKNLVSETLQYLKNTEGFKHFVMLSCVDWLEEGKFELVYIVWHPEQKVSVAVKTKIDRENAEFQSLHTMWRQLCTYEREIWEMYGINFVGHPRLEPFILEDWKDAPPMRRDFDTLHFVEEHYEMRGGREERYQPRDFIGEVFDEWRKK